jgi:non-specific serine/threonine protein kinase
LSGSLTDGTTFAGYRIAGLLGRGGMGFVYEAEHLLLKRKAALKTLAPQLDDDGEFKRRFIRESQTVAAIDHPNIIPIYDAGDLEGIAYISMRFVNGSDLGGVIESGLTADPREALTILEQVAGALDAAHAHSIVHRDIKPPNVMIEQPSGRVYLMDFGIATRGEPSGTTSAGGFFGTVDYAAPEQIESKEVTAAADVYAFGALLYETLTGRKPYVRDNAIAVMFAHMSEPPPRVSEADARLPPGLDAVVERAMAKAPGDRFPSCREMIETARAALGAHGSTPVGDGASRAPAKVAAAEEDRSNLPTPLTSLIGRDDELDALSRLLRDPTVRLATLTGLGGTGKTRLAVEAAHAVAEAFQRTALVDLSPVRDSELVGSAIAQAVGAREQPGYPLAAAIADVIDDDSMLMVIDDFGHVVEASALVAEILAAAPSLKALVTSRTPLHIRGEHELAVYPLDVPSLDGQAAASGAVRLFVERAQEARLDFELTAENEGDVFEICRRLEGIPLALELAAARIKILTPAQIVARMGENRLAFLTGSGRQETLRDAIEWSYRLLDNRGKSLFSRLGVFGGGTSLETAESVAGASLDLAFGEVLDTIASLVDNGLVRQLEATDGEPRFTMLETIREFALERLTEEGAVVEMRGRHLGHFVDLAETAEPELTRANQAVWLERLTEENDNIRAALAWSFESGQVELGLRLAGALVRFWSVRGLMREGRRWLAAALAESPEASPSVLGKAYFAAGFAALGQGDYFEAKPAFERSLVLARKAGDVRLEAQALQQIGWVVRTGGTYREDHVERARDLAEKALELSQGIGDKLVQSGALNILADVALETGDEETANDLYARSLALRRELGDGRLIANSVLTLGRAELARGQVEAAGTLLDEAYALAGELGDTWSTSLALVDLGRIALLARHGDEAAQLFARSLELAKARGDKRVLAENLQGIAATEAIRGGSALAAQLFAAAALLLETIAVTHSPIETRIEQEFRTPLEIELGAEAYAAESAAGRSWEADEAVEQGIRSATRPIGDAAEVVGG